MHRQAGPYISMQAPDMTGVVPNVTIVTPKIVALTIGQRLSSITILHTWKFTGTDTTLLEYNYSLPQVNNSVNES